MLKIFLILMMIVMPVLASGRKCGIKPPPPVNNLWSTAVCACDEKGFCQWVYIKK